MSRRSPHHTGAEQSMLASLCVFGAMLHIGNLPDDTSQGELETFFRDYECYDRRDTETSYPPISVKLVARGSRKVAYVLFPYADVAHEAVAHLTTAGHEYGGQRLKVTMLYTPKQKSIFEEPESDVDDEDAATGDEAIPDSWEDGYYGI